MSTAITNIFHAYPQVDYSDDSYTVLGLSQFDSPSAAEVKAAYHTLALFLHPDKAPSDDLVNASSRLFQKLQHAQNELLMTSPATPTVFTYKVILEGPISLHQRNLAFKAALRERREAELQKKRELDTKKALDKTKAEKKSETIAKARSDRPAEKFANLHSGTIEEAAATIADIIKNRAELKPLWRQDRDHVNRATVKSRKKAKKDKRQKQRNRVAEETEQAIDVNTHDFMLALPEDMPIVIESSF